MSLTQQKESESLWSQGENALNSIIQKSEHVLSAKLLVFCRLRTEQCLGVVSFGICYFSLELDSLFSVFAANRTMGQSSEEINKTLAHIESLICEVVDLGLNESLAGRKFCYALSALKCYFELQISFDFGKFKELLICVLEV